MDNPTDPSAQAVLDDLAKRATDQATLSDAVWVRSYRKTLDGFIRFQPAARPDVTAENLRVGELSVRVFRPDGGGRSRPALLWCHGGGFIGGSLDSYARPLSHLAGLSGWVVVAPDYRLAPEHRHPAPVDDGRAALEWLRNAEGVDGTTLAIGGDSCGGLIATWVATPELRALIMLYPNADLRPDATYESRRRFNGNVVKLAESDRGLAMYLGDIDPASHGVSPALVDAITGRPPSLLVTCAHDPLRDEGEAMGRAIAAGGTSIEHVRLPAMIHGILTFSAAIPAGAALIERVAARLRAISDPSVR